MTERTLELSISKSNLYEAIGDFLCRMGFVNFNEDVVDIKLGNMDNDPVPLCVTIKEFKYEEPKAPIASAVPDEQEMPDIPDFLKKEQPEDLLKGLRKYL